MTAEPVQRYPDVDGRTRAARPSPGRAGAPTRTRAAQSSPSSPPARTSPTIPRPRGEAAGLRGPTARRAAPPAPVRAPRAPFVALVAAVVVAGIVGLLVLNTAINSSSLALQHLRDRQDRLDAQEQQLNQELADRESPGSLRAAATRLGLVPAGTTAFIRLPDGKVIGVPQPAPGSRPAGG